MANPLSRLTKTILVTGAALLVLSSGAEAKHSKGKSKRRAKKAETTKTVAEEKESSSTKSWAPALPKQFSTVVIDAGHGGHDPGGIPQNLMPEKNVALDVAKRVEAHLKEAGLNTVMTRSDDTFVTLSDRCTIANAQKNAIFVSIHFNSALRQGARGVETYYGPSVAEPLAQLINRNMMAVTENPEYRGVKHANYHVLRKTTMPAVLAECGFLTNPGDTAMAAQASHREKLATQIANAIVEYRRSLSGT